ncbi:hypothetical protein NVP1055O_04 [Vibrio phage 1.055.O._10N.286.55.E9]|nr:hypothetical protein NVP1055O_04 [Vibrio phage 1.055.O._10N.286.55.E9]
MSLLTAGDVIILNPTHTIYASVPRHFVSPDHVGDFTLFKTLVNLSNPDFAYLQGHYIVTHTAMAGGRTGLNPHPNGYHVTCVSSNKRHTVHFYQTGCFTAMITEQDIKPIGKAVMSWSIV